MDILKEWSGDSERTLSKYYLHANQNDLVQIGKEKLQIGEENSRQILLKLVKEMDEEEAEETINSIIKNRNKKANIE